MQSHDNCNNHDGNNNCRCNSRMMSNDDQWRDMINILFDLDRENAITEQARELYHYYQSRGNATESEG